MVRPFSPLHFSFACLFPPFERCFAVSPPLVAQSSAIQQPESNPNRQLILSLSVSPAAAARSAVVSHTPHSRQRQGTPFTSLTPSSRGTGSLPPTYHKPSARVQAITTWHPSPLSTRLYRQHNSSHKDSSQYTTEPVRACPSLAVPVPVPLSWVRNPNLTLPR